MHALVQKHHQTKMISFGIRDDRWHKHFNMSHWNGAHCPSLANVKFQLKKYKDILLHISCKNLEIFLIKEQKG